MINKLTVITATDTQVIGASTDVTGVKHIHAQTLSVDDPNGLETDRFS